MAGNRRSVVRPALIKSRTPFTACTRNQAATAADSAWQPVHRQPPAATRTTDQTIARGTPQPVPLAGGPGPTRSAPVRGRPRAARPAHHLPTMIIAVCNRRTAPHLGIRGPGRPDPAAAAAVSHTDRHTLQLLRDVTSVVSVPVPSRADLQSGSGAVHDSRLTESDARYGSRRVPTRCGDAVDTGRQI